MKTTGLFCTPCTLGAWLITAMVSTTMMPASANQSDVAKPYVAKQARVISSAADYAVLPDRERPAVENAILTKRLEQLLPQLMADAELDMWLIINREYAEDPVYFTLVPQPTYAARRTTMLVFHRLADGSVERLSVNRYPLGSPYESAWSGGDLTDQWQALADLIVEKDPNRIGINVSRHWPVADGLTQGLHERLLEALPSGLHNRLTSAENLVVRWVETRTDEEINLFAQAVGLARGVIAEAFSSAAITPGVTTTDELGWFIRERFSELNLPIWFQPYVTRQRQGQACDEDTAFCGQGGLIERGDVIRTDVGICYLKMCTDTQEIGYIMPVGAEQMPAGLEQAMATMNRGQDILTDQFTTGRTGNEILAAALAQSRQEGIRASIYTHPIGFYGHAPGPTIGMWDNQGNTPIQGDWPLYPSTAYAIEGNVKVAIPEWDGQLLQLMYEQSAWFNGQQVNYLAGRQTGWHLIR